MTLTKTRFASFEEYLLADPSDLPEGRCEYWDGELVPVMSESLLNEAIANYLAFVLFQMGIDSDLISPGKVSIVVSGRPKTRFPDLTLLDDSPGTDGKQHPHRLNDATTPACGRNRFTW